MTQLAMLSHTIFTYRKNEADRQALSEMETRHYNIERRNRQVVLPSSSDVSTVGQVISNSLASHWSIFASTFHLIG